MALKTFFCLFLIDFRPSQIPKNIGPAEDFEYFHICVLIALETDLGPIFGSILDSKIAPKSVPRGSRRVLEIMAVFACLREPPKIILFAQHGPNLVPKMAPSWAKNRSKIGTKTDSEATSAPDLILDSFWSNFGMIFCRFWAEFGTMFR